MFVNDWDGGPYINAAGLNYTASPNEHAGRHPVGCAGPFDTGRGLGEFVPRRRCTSWVMHVYTNYSFNIAPVVGGGGTFQLRFAEVDNQGNFNQGVDNVSILTTVPEPSTLALLGIGAFAVIGYVWRRRA